MSNNFLVPHNYDLTRKIVTFIRSRAQIFLFLSIILGLSITICWIIWKIFPYGVVDHDTPDYFYLAKGFHVFHSNSQDWGRTIPTGAMLWISTLFTNPTVAVYWFHASLFSISMALTFWFVTNITRSLWIAFILTITLILLEAFLMQTLYRNIVMFSDSLYSYLVFAGTLLALGSWIRQSSSLSYFAYGLLGLAAFTRPIGIVLFPLWIIFTFFAFRTKMINGKSILQWKRVVICSLLILGPVTIWSSRNFVLYGHFKMTAIGQANLSAHAMLLMEDEDILFSDSETNDQFITTVRKFESIVGKKRNTYNHLGTVDNPGPLQFIMPLTKSYTRYKESKTMLDYVKMRFETHEIGGKIATRIIRAHLGEYLGLVMQNYLASFSNLIIPPSMKSVEIHYRYALDLRPEWALDAFVALYPPDGKIDLSLSNETFRNALNAFCCDNSIRRFLISQKNWYPIFSHLILIFSCFCYVLSRFKDIKLLKVIDSQTISIVMIMLFLNAAVHYAATAAVAIPEARYTLPGEIGLNVMYLLSLMLLVYFLFEKIFIPLRSHIQTKK